MFKKLLKYDMMAVWRLWWIAVMIVPIAAVVGSAMLRFIIEGTENLMFEDPISTLLLMGAILVVFACLVAIAHTHTHSKKSQRETRKDRRTDKKKNGKRQAMRPSMLRYERAEKN